MFWCGQIHNVGKWEGVGPWKLRVFWALWNGIEPIGECHLGPKKLPPLFTVLFPLSYIPRFFPLSFITCLLSPSFVLCPTIPNTMFLSPLPFSALVIPSPVSCLPFPCPLLQSRKYFFGLLHKHFCCLRISFLSQIVLDNRYRQLKSPNFATIFCINQFFSQKIFNMISYFFGWGSCLNSGPYCWLSILDLCQPLGLVFCAFLLWRNYHTSLLISSHCDFYATLVYIRHFIFAGCYDKSPWYLITILAGH